jgi:disulfide oxidoreductase YuzD
MKGWCFMDSLDIVVYGSNTPCSGCVHSPSSIETKEWIEAAIHRKFPDYPLAVRYVDIEQPENERDRGFCDRILAEELFYPLVVIDGKVVGEGDPRIKTIYEAIKNHGFEPAVL